ncbi:C-type lectin domain family 10 member A-like [Thomomys bottae]
MSSGFHVGSVVPVVGAGPSLQDMIQSLKAKVEEHRQELQTDQSAIFLQIQQLVKDLKTLTRDLGDQKSNGSGMICCPVNWTLHKGSCYWFSQSRKSWPEASQFCQLNKAHLVVINSKEEQEFLQDNMSLKNIWLGLTDQNGPWRWADGTDYQTGFKYWKPKQPDNWHGHGMGGGEDCAHLDLSGFWNDDVCKKSYYWICEAELDKAS